MIDRWAQLGSHAPRVANFLGTAPKYLLQKALDLAPQRQMPRLATTSFQQWARKHRVPASGGSVILWADTFNNYYKPETSQAALEVLTHAGFSVTVPQKHLCCGRPLYDFGMLDKARQYLLHILQTLAPEIDAGRPIVVLEPSCASVFRDELVQLFPEDPRAGRLRKQTFLLSEFLQQHVPGYQPPQRSQKLLLHGHCHHKAIMKMTDEETLLRKTGADLKTLDAGCCGMAGPFGFAKDKYAVSQAIGERVLLPAVRAAEPETTIVSDGFSCREQILQATGKKALHLAEVLQQALHP
jgi:Fe-S oxidoreductase